MKNFTTVKDVDNIDELVSLARDIKKDPLSQSSLGRHKTLCLLFFNPSLRTRLSTQKAAYNLDMNVMVMNINKDSWQIEFEDNTVMNGGTQEHVKEAAGVISQYADIVGIRTFPSLVNKDEDYNDAVLSRFLDHIDVPVISLESAILHPLQSLADAITIAEYATKPKPKVVLTWAPHPKALPQAVANSFVEWMAGSDVELVITNPKGFDLAEQYSSLGKVEHDQMKAFEEADFIYAKNWSSFENYGNIGTELGHWIIDEDKMKLTDNARFMHCLPVRRNVVVTDKVIDSDRSLVIQQAENRIYASQSVLVKLLEDEK